MAPTESPENRHVPLLQFIVALLLVKSKPSSLSSSDFRKQMVSYIEKGPRSNSTQADAHLNMTAFWRNKSTGLEEENAALEAKVSRLQTKVSELEEREAVWKRKSAELEDSARLQRLKRRRDGEPAEESSSRSAKQARTKDGAVALNERDEVRQDLISNEPGYESDELGNNLLDSLRNLQGSSRASGGNKLRPKDLALKLSSIATDVCRYVSAIDLPADFQKITSTALLATTPRSKEQVAGYPQTAPDEIMERRLTSVGKSFPHFLTHLHTLGKFPRSGNLCGQVVYRFIDVFRVLFQRICDLAVANARSNQDRPKTTKKRGCGREKQGTTSSSDEKPATSPTIMKLCELLITMLFHLDPIKVTHKAIFDGCLYLLLTRVGEVLKDFTIGGRPLGIEEDVMTSTHNPYLREGRQLKISSAENDTEASEAQAPYLTWMLKHAQRFISSTSLATNATTTSQGDDHRQPEMAQPNSSRNSMYDDAHIRLQHTLVRAVFGAQAAASFEPALEPPRIPPDDELMTEFDTQNETADVRDRFKNEVWRIVGWDVLRGNLAWD